MTTEVELKAQWICTRRELYISSKRGKKLGAAYEDAITSKYVDKQGWVWWKIVYEDDENDYKEDYPEVPRDGHPDGFLNLFLPIKHDGAFAILDEDDDDQKDDWLNYLDEHKLEDDDENVSSKCERQQLIRACG